MSEQFQLDPGPPQKPITGGYAAQPGSGPDGETCRTCEFYCRVKYHGRWFLKCGHARAPAWTHGGGTDIKAKTPACRFWSCREDAVRSAARALEEIAIYERSQQS